MTFAAPITTIAKSINREIERVSPGFRYKLRLMSSTFSWLQTTAVRAKEAGTLVDWPLSKPVDLNRNSPGLSSLAQRVSLKCPKVAGSILGVANSGIIC